MATIYTAAIQELYVAYFNRPADPDGLAYWETVVAANNGNTAGVSAAFAASAEYKAEYDQLTISGVVTQIYQNLFNRAPDSAGLAYWVKGIQDKNFTIDQAVKVIADGAVGTDDVAFNSKVLVATAFTAAVDTPAEKAGYAGEMALDAAKAMLAKITTAAQAAAAVVPATLDASVAAVIKAGVPFSLTTALSDLAAAEDAVDAFFAAADGDDDEDTSTTKDALEAAVLAAEVELDAVVDGAYVGNTPGVKAALLADQVAEFDTALVTAQAAVATANANVAKVPGLATAVTNLAAAKGVYTAATKTTLAASSTLAGEVAKYNTAQTLDVTVAANGTVTRTNADLSLTDVIIVNAQGVLVFNPAASLTDAQKTALTPLLAATTAKEAADKAETAALASQTAAQKTVDRTDYVTSAIPADDASAELVAVGNAMTIVQIAAGAKPTAAQINTEIAALAAVKAAADAAVTAAGPDVTADQTAAATAAANAVTAFNDAVAAFDAADTTNPLVAALNTATADVKTANDNITALADLIADLQEAQALVAELEGLEDAVTAAEKAFTDNDFATPIAVAGVVGATADSDIYMASDVNSTIVNFGLVGDDKLFIGTDYTLNTSTKVSVGGNNSVLEVFLIQVGADTVVTLENVAFGSNSAAEAETTITLTGVNVADVTFANGIITVG
ncbi:DUF4214 domain-containing protein [Massilia soli]|uniref:DUF4214 domain-containing protein n=1 Tax=Massilia soli TaxID=2792854 RepID=A0ABS7STP2_9BURK|nr:DUF4214 domain-containing protein [Massilia soli]MBZ2209307.1 DUF4214 domain-containing protein [Massilia soli]